MGATGKSLWCALYHVKMVVAPEVTLSLSGAPPKTSGTGNRKRINSRQPVL
jgi:hypothetical protein